MKRRKAKAGHQVSFTIPHRPLGKADIRFRIAQSGRRFGELFISKGAVVWYPRSKQLGFKLSWSRFDDLVRKYGRRGRGL